GQPDVLGAVGARVVDVLVGVVRGISLHAPVGARADARGPGAVRGVVVDPAARLDEVQLPVSADRVPGERDADVGLDAVLGRDVHDLDGGAARVGPQELEELLTTEQGQLDGIAPFVVHGDDPLEGGAAGSTQVVGSVPVDAGDDPGEPGAGDGASVQHEGPPIGLRAPITDVRPGLGVL